MKKYITVHNCNFIFIEQHKKYDSFDISGGSGTWYHADVVAVVCNDDYIQIIKNRFGRANPYRIYFKKICDKYAYTKEVNKFINVDKQITLLDFIEIELKNKIHDFLSIS